jgi:hypothetical protein
MMKTLSKESQVLMSGPEDSLAKTSASPTKASARDLQADDRASSIDLSSWLKNIRIDHPGSSLRTSRDSLIATEEPTSASFSENWKSSGISWRGEYLTLDTLEHLNHVDECSLSQVIKTTAPPECFLSQEHLAKWLWRAEARAPNLEPSLRQAFLAQLCMQYSTPPSVEDQIGRARKVRDSATMDSPTRSTLAEVPTWSVRRMMASEYEVLQGFPENWTDVD